MKLGFHSATGDGRVSPKLFLLPSEALLLLLIDVGDVEGQEDDRFVAESEGMVVGEMGEVMESL